MDPTSGLIIWGWLSPAPHWYDTNQQYDFNKKHITTSNLTLKRSLGNGSWSSCFLELWNPVMLCLQPIINIRHRLVKVLPAWLKQWQLWQLTADIRWQWFITLSCVGQVDWQCSARSVTDWQLTTLIDVVDGTMAIINVWFQQLSTHTHTHTYIWQ